jgi:hypothetical protein
MSKLASITAALAIALGAGPALAAPSDAPANPPATPPAASSNAAPAPAASANPPPSHQGTATVASPGSSPSQRNPLLADNGDVRMSKLIGTDVYSEQDKKLGSIDDVLMGSSGQPDVVISSSDKLVQVPWNKLKFGDAKLNSDNKVIMQDETQQSMKQMPQFKYTAKD